MKISSKIAIALVLIPSLALSQVTTQDSSNWLKDAALYAKIFAAVLTGLGTLFGLPLALLLFKKTRAEIRKFELEAAVLEGKVNVDGNMQSGTTISISHSKDLNIQVLADPRFLGPLLLLLDFIFAWVIITLAGIFLNIIHLGIISSALLALIALILLLPIAKEALRVKRVLKPENELSLPSGSENQSPP